MLRVFSGAQHRVLIIIYWSWRETKISSKSKLPLDIFTRLGGGGSKIILEDGMKFFQKDHAGAMMKNNSGKYRAPGMIFLERSEDRSAR